MKYISIPEHEYKSTLEELKALQEIHCCEYKDQAIVRKELWDGILGVNVEYRIVTKDKVIHDLNERCDEMKKDWSDLYDELASTRGKAQDTKNNYQLVVAGLCVGLVVSIISIICLAV